MPRGGDRVSGSNGNGNGNGHARPTGRIPTFETDPDVRKAILDAVELGLSDKDACTLAGISTRALMRWKNAQGEAYRRFRHDLRCARMRGKEQRLDAIRRAFDARAEEPDWRAAAWLMARQYPEEFSEKRILEHVKASKPSNRRKALHDPEVRAALARAASRLGTIRAPGDARSVSE
jgi:hypothetical protein